MGPLRASTTKSDWSPDDPTASAPTTLWKLLSITTWDASRNQNPPTDSAEEANKLMQVIQVRMLDLCDGLADTLAAIIPEKFIFHITDVHKVEDRRDRDACGN